MKLGLARRGHSPTGGAEAYLKRFATAVAAAGHECVLFTTREWPAAGWPGEIRRIKHGGSPLEFALSLQEMRAREACDFLLSLERVLECDAYRAGDGVHAAWLDRQARYEPAWRTWFRGRQTKHHELLRLEETMFRGEAAGAVIANSELVKGEIVSRFGYPAERIHVIYNGVPPALDEAESAQARVEVRQELGLRPSDYVLLFAGSGWQRKGLRFAIEAINEAALARPTLLVAGSGKPGRMPRSNRVRFLGPVTGLSRYLAAADAFILPTIYDPFSNACLEALAAGLPVITTTANGFAEVLDRGVDGEVLDEPADTLALARAIERWAPQDQRTATRARLREKGAQFSVEENARRTLSIIEQHRRI